MPAPRPARGGFTLLETLLALAILGLVLAVAVPALVVTPGAGLRAAAELVATGLRQARVTAVREQRPVALLLDVEARALRVEGRQRVRTLPREVTLELHTAQGEIVDARRGGIRFYPDGSSTGGRVTLTRQGMRTDVDVEWLTGRVRIREDGA